MKKSSVKFAVFSLVLCFSIAAFGFYEANAATIPVTNFNDSGAGSLRQAIIDANATSEADIIQFQTGSVGIVNLLSALPVLSTDITINGTGVNSSIIRRSVTTPFRIFTISPSVVIVLNNLTVANGFAVPGGSKSTTFVLGSGIYNEGNLTVTDSRISENKATAPTALGGGIYNRGSGIINIKRTEFSVNRAETTCSGCPGSLTPHGSSIYNLGTVSIEDSDFTVNAGSETLYNEGTMTIVRTNILGNGETGIESGGISLVVKQSTISNNSRGISTFRGTTNITNSTISGNQNGGVVSGNFISSSITTVKNSTIVLNGANSGILGGGYNVGNCGGICSVSNSIIAGNVSDLVGNVSFASTYNLIGDGTGGNLSNGVAGNIVGTAASPIDARVAPLGNYGGRLLTHALYFDSPAINAAHPTIFEPIDERGVPRPVGGRSDIGAFEFNLTPHSFLPKGGLNTFYSQTLTAFTNVSKEPFIFSVGSGNLPPGLSLTAIDSYNAVISGMPTQTGTYNFTVNAFNQNGFTVSASYTLVIQNAISFVSVSGRVIGANGRGVSGAIVSLVGAEGNKLKSSFTNPFGYYRFTGIQAQEIYKFSVSAKNRTFTEQIVEVNNNIANLNFTSQ